MCLDYTKIRIEILLLWNKDCKKMETECHVTVLEIGLLLTYLLHGEESFLRS